MDKRKFTRSRIREILVSGASLDTAKAIKLTGRIIEALAAALAAGETVELRGLGTLEVRKRPVCIRRNPHTGEAVNVPPCGNRPRKRFRTLF